MSYKVLIADAEIGTARQVESCLNALPGVEVAAIVADGRAAYGEAKRQMPEIIITDICMPRMTGFELLQKLQQDGMKAKTVIISGCDSFDYVRKAMNYGVKDYILKPFRPEELTKQLGKLIRALDQERQLEQDMESLRQRSDRNGELMSGYLLRDILDRKCRELAQIDPVQRHSFPFEAKGYCVCMAREKNRDNKWNFSFRSSLDEFTALFYRQVFGESIHFYAVPAGRDCFVLVFADTGGNGGFKERLMSGLNRLAKHMKTDYGSTIYFALGNVCDKWEKLPDSYDEARHVFKTLVVSDACLYSCDAGGSGGQTEETGDFQQTCAGILMNVKMGNGTEAKEQVSVLMKRGSMLSGAKCDFMMACLAETAWEINCFLEKNKYINTLEDQRNLEGFYNDIKSRIQYGNFAETGQVWDAYIGECCRLVEAHLAMDRSDRISEQLKFIVESNLDNEELSIEMVAEKMNLRPNYIRRIFREKAGEGFSVYVFRHRMEKAAKLLSGTDMKIQDIAQGCGYGNQQYFTYSFKKAYGVTPSAYKKSMSGAECMKTQSTLSVL